MQCSAVQCGAVRVSLPASSMAWLVVTELPDCSEPVSLWLDLIFPVSLPCCPGRLLLWPHPPHPAVAQEDVGGVPGGMPGHRCGGFAGRCNLLCSRLPGRRGQQLLSALLPCAICTFETSVLTPMLPCFVACCPAWLPCSDCCLVWLPADVAVQVVHLPAHGGWQQGGGARAAAAASALFMCCSCACCRFQ